MAESRKILASRSYDLNWEFIPRLAVEHLGSQKYSTSTKALRELVANALDAGATLVEIRLAENELGGLESVTVQDNGKGISPADLRNRFCKIGVVPEYDSPARLGRFGIGRLAVHRIGLASEWQSVSKSDRKTVRVAFKIAGEMGEVGNALKVTEDEVSSAEPTGTWIKIVNLRDESNERLSAGRIKTDLAAQFCSFLLGNPGRRITVQDESIDVEAIIKKKEVERFRPFGKNGPGATMTHLMLESAVEQSRFPAQLLFSGKGVTVAHLRTERPPSPQYLGIVDCDYLNDIVTADREALIEMDDGFTKLKQLAVLKMIAFGERRQAELSRGFIERARGESFYPYRSPPTDPVSSVEQAVYDVVLEKLNESTNIEAMTKRQQEVVFRLLRRALDDENILEVLDEVARLSDEDLEKFRRVLEHTTLECIIKLSSEVTTRLAFLDVLHQLVYGPTEKHLKERAHLHKIIEPQCWIFGPQFHLATSDKSFRRVVQSHRKLAGLEEVDDSNLNAIAGVGDIPDLFLAASREYPVKPKNNHVLVELKAPRVALGANERDQIRRYAQILRESHEFDKRSTRWDLFLVSAKVTSEIQDDRRQKDKPHGVLWDWSDMTVWAFEWSEIIQKARDELSLVRDHLHQKSQDLTVRRYLQENFPNVLVDLDKKAAASTAKKKGDH